ncbi:hypothetical protein, partial [uncultured Chryseobacterium sp.]|uniref:hypothetical protein n=1 Tax=uncultured Chryseobacterium sp. TaxID=259322 RepID=UPI0025EF3B79
QSGQSRNKKLNIREAVILKVRSHQAFNKNKTLSFPPQLLCLIRSLGNEISVLPENFTGFIL